LLPHVPVFATDAVLDLALQEELRAAVERALVLLSSHAEECVAQDPAATKASAGRASRKSLIAHLQKVV
jgi:hypothetical protein